MMNEATTILSGMGAMHYDMKNDLSLQGGGTLNALMAEAIKLKQDAQDEHEKGRAEHLAQLKAAKVDLESVSTVISSVQYWRPEGTTVTVAAVQTFNGFTFIGKSATQPATTFDAELGEQYALKDAQAKIIDAEVYLLREAIFNAQAAA